MCIDGKERKLEIEVWIWEEGNNPQIAPTQNTMRHRLNQIQEEEKTHQIL